MKNRNFKVRVSYSAFEIARLGKDAIYARVDELVRLEFGRSIEAQDMIMKPLDINEDEVLYECEVVMFNASVDGV